MPLTDVPNRSAFLRACGLACALVAGPASAQEPKPPPAATAVAPAVVSSQAIPSPGDPHAVVDRIRAALAKQDSQNRLHVLVGDDPITPPGVSRAPAADARSRTRAKAPSSQRSTAVTAARSTAWSYAGPNGPETWGRLQPDFGTCSSGQRQAPIDIDTRQTLQGPAEPLQLTYGSGGGSVVHTGHAIEVDVSDPHTLTVRGSTYRLQQLRFHHPAEVRIDGKTHAMAVHLVHRNDQGQTAVLVVLLEPGDTHPEIHKLWTHMPLEVKDRVPLPDGLLNPKALLPADARYFQFMGSLSAPPCTEGVLWLVMKQAVTISPEQLRLYAQLFPMNARPVQALNGRVVREGM